MERSNTHPYTQDELVQNHICNECGVERVVDDEDNICQTCYHKSCDEGECYCCYGDDEDEDDEDEETHEDEDEGDEDDDDVDSEGFDIIWCADCGEARVYDKHYCEKCENEDGEEEEE